MKKQEVIISNPSLSSKIANKIVVIRDVQVMIDRDLAELYGVETKALNQAVKRNTERFPDYFCFQLDKEESLELVTNCDRFNILKHSSSNPYAFTEQGVAMLSAVLRSEKGQLRLETHDRFLFIDNKDRYHIGASLKDLGKQCFAFEKMDDPKALIPAILTNLS